MLIVVKTRTKTSIDSERKGEKVNGVIKGFCEKITNLASHIKRTHKSLPSKEVYLRSNIKYYAKANDL